MKPIDYSEGGVELLDEVSSLWEKLNELHCQRSRHFAERYRRMTFAQRKSGLLAKADPQDVFVSLARDAERDVWIGYVIATVTCEEGEIDSLYVDATHRGMGAGEGLMRRALNWLKGKPVNTRKLLVAAGNEEVLAFYARFGFYPKHILLEQTEK